MIVIALDGVSHLAPIKDNSGAIIGESIPAMNVGKCDGTKHYYFVAIYFMLVLLQAFV